MLATPLPPAPPKTPLAVLKIERKVGVRSPGPTYRLYVKGRRTGLALETWDGNAKVEAHITPDGVIYGTTTTVESGAYTDWRVTAFVSDRGRFVSKPRYSVEGFRDRLILVATQKGPWTNTREGYLYASHRFTKIGPTTEAEVDADGTVRGWFLADGHDRPFNGVTMDRPASIVRRGFVWRDGKRTLTDRRPVPRA